jgi:hypothetical protein
VSVAFDGNSIAPFVLSQRPEGGEQEKDKEEEARWGSGKLGWVPLGSDQVRAV